jgi:hypothetical protein
LDVFGLVRVGCQPCFIQGMQAGSVTGPGGQPARGDPGFPPTFRLTESLPAASASDTDGAGAAGGGVPGTPPLRSTRSHSVPLESRGRGGGLLPTHMHAHAHAGYPLTAYAPAHAHAVRPYYGSIVPATAHAGSAGPPGSGTHYQPWSHEHVAASMSRAAAPAAASASAVAPAPWLGGSADYYYPGASAYHHGGTADPALAWNQAAAAASGAMQAGVRLPLLATLGPDGQYLLLPPSPMTADALNWYAAHGHISVPGTPSGAAALAYSGSGGGGGGGGGGGYAQGMHLHLHYAYTVRRTTTTRARTHTHRRLTAVGAGVCVSVCVYVCARVIRPTCPRMRAPHPRLCGRGGT